MAATNVSVTEEVRLHVPKLNVVVVIKINFTLFQSRFQKVMDATHVHVMPMKILGAQN